MKSVPTHHENAETIGLIPLQAFDGANSARPGQKARKRPADRPRPTADDLTGDRISFFSEERVGPTPPGYITDTH